MIKISEVLLFKVYTPIRQKRKIKGARRTYGILSTCTQRPIIGRFKSISMPFPIYMLAMNPQKISGCSEMRKGPGVIPWIISAARSIAVTTPVGIPKESMGIKALEVAALLADSGPATPSITPVPKSSGCRETFFSIA
jgi:hypothetical protein